MQCRRPTGTSGPRTSSASPISPIVEAPVESSTGLPKLATSRRNGCDVMSADAILNTSTRSARNVADSASNGVDMNSIPTSSQWRLRTSKSSCHRVSYLENSARWVGVDSFVVSQYAGLSLTASVSAL